MYQHQFRGYGGPPGLPQQQRQFHGRPQFRPQRQPQFQPRGPPRNYGGPRNRQPQRPPLQQRHPYIEQLDVVNKWPFSQTNRTLLDICKRHKRSPPSDLVGMTAYFAESEPRGSFVDTPKAEVNMSDDNKITLPPTVEPTGDLHQYAFVLPFTGTVPDSTNSRLHLLRRLSFLVNKPLKRCAMAYGGPYNPECDGPSTDGVDHLKSTAQRCIKEQSGMDLASCQGWEPFSEFRYVRDRNNQRVRVVYFVVDVTSLPDISPAKPCEEQQKEVTEEVEEKHEEGEGEQKKVVITKKNTTRMETVQVPICTPAVVNLNDLRTAYAPHLSVDRESEQPYELALVAECIDEMLHRYFGEKLLALLKDRRVQVREEQKKRKREEEELAAAKKLKTEESTEKKEGDDEEKKEESAPQAEEKKKEAEPVKKMKTVVDQEVVRIFSFFDRSGPQMQMHGNIRKAILEGLLHSIGGMCREEIDDLLASVGLKRSLRNEHGSNVLNILKVASSQVEDDTPPPQAAEPENPQTGDTEMKEAPAEEGTTKAAEETAEAPAATEANPEPTSEAEPAAGSTDSTEAKPTVDEVNKMLVADLKAYCNKAGLPATGKKADLAARVLADIGAK